MARALIREYFIGKDVWYLGRVWRVSAAKTGSSQGSPWLFLTNGKIRVLAKPHEVKEAFN
jgi:hypothetical protein